MICHLQRFFAELTTRDPFNAFPTEWCMILPLFFFLLPPLEGEQNDIYFSHFARICRRHDRMGIRNDHTMIVITGKFKKKKGDNYFLYPVIISCNSCFYKRVIILLHFMYSTLI